jgi:hypothetical protein
LLNLLKNQSGGNEAQTLIAKLPGAEDVMQSAGASTGSSGTFGGGGMLGGLSSAMGQSGGALAALHGSGLSASQAGPFVKLLSIMRAKKQAQRLLTESSIKYRR